MSRTARSTQRRPVTAPVSRSREASAPSAADEHLTAAQLAHFRARLIAMRESLLTPGNALAEATPTRGDDADIAGAASERIASLTDMARRRNLLREVTAALARIESGDYGFCEATGEPIGAARLEANPTARYSVETQARIERHRAMRGR